MEITRILSLFWENSLQLVISAIFLWFIVNISNIFFSYLREISSRQILEKKREKMKIESINDEKVNNILKQMLYKFSPDRIMILQYHNWNYFNCWHHMKFLSWSHEVTKPWISKEVMNMQRIPSGVFSSTSLFLEWKRLVKASKKENQNMIWWDYDTLYTFPIKNYKDEILWLVTMWTIKESISYNLEDIEEISGYVKVIQHLFDN